MTEELRSPSRMTRRAFLISLGLGVGLAATGGVWTWRRFAHPTPEDELQLIDRILVRTPYLHIEPATRARFAADFMAYDGAPVRQALGWLGDARIYGTGAQGWMAGPKGAAAIERAERLVVTAALLSTGFFDTRPYGSGPVAYRGWPVVCGNPFAARGAHV